MYCTRKIHPDLYWVGGNDRRLALFENMYPISRGVSYNSYILLDEQTVLLDTVDRAINDLFFENIEHARRDANWTMSSSTTWNLTTALLWPNWFFDIPI